jgi:hypothetical protein
VTPEAAEALVRRLDELTDQVRVTAARLDKVEALLAGEDGLGRLRATAGETEASLGRLQRPGAADPGRDAQGP